MDNDPPRPEDIILECTEYKPYWYGNNKEKYYTGKNKRNKYKNESSSKEPFNVESYDLFNYEGNFTSEESFDDDSEDLEGYEADDESSEKVGDDGQPILSTKTNSEFPKIEKETDVVLPDIYDIPTFSEVDEEDLKDLGFEDPKEYFEKDELDIDNFEAELIEITKRQKRLVPKKWKPNPLHADPNYKPPVNKEEERLQAILNKVNTDDIKMPPEEMLKQPYKVPPKDHPDYLGEIPVNPELLPDPPQPWYKEVPVIFPEDYESTSPPPNSDFITDSTEFFSTEEDYDEDQLSPAPEDEPLYPSKWDKWELPPQRHPTQFIIQQMPPNNPEVQSWYDDDAKEYFDVKNEKGEWETVEQVNVIYPPVPYWERMKKEEEEKDGGKKKKEKKKKKKTIGMPGEYSGPRVGDPEDDSDSDVPPDDGLPGGFEAGLRYGKGPPFDKESPYVFPWVKESAETTPTEDPTKLSDPNSASEQSKNINIENIIQLEIAENTQGNSHETHIQSCESPLPSYSSNETINKEVINYERTKGSPNIEEILIDSRKKIKNTEKLPNRVEENDLNWSKMCHCSVNPTKSFINDFYSLISKDEWMTCVFNVPASFEYPVLPHGQTNSTLVADLTFPMWKGHYILR